MGQQDLQQSEYFDSNVWFADACNGILFNGQSIIQPEELEEGDSVFVQLFDTQKGKKVIANKVKKWKGQHLVILLLENQTYVDYRMVLRVMQEEVMIYEKQRKTAVNDMALTGQKFGNNSEFLSGMKKEWKFTPVIPVIIYLGKETEWDGAITLYDLLEMDEALKPFVNNYKLNFYDYHKESDFSKFKTENRYLFELLFYNNNQEKIEQILQNANNCNNLDSEAVEVLLNAVDIHVDIETIKEFKDGKEKYNVCKAIEDMKNDARKEGIDIGYKSGMEELLNTAEIDIETIKEVKDGKERYNVCKAIEDIKKDAKKEGIDIGYKSAIEALMESLNMSLEQALDTLKIDEEIRKNFYV